MKNYFAIFCLAIALFTSCSKDKEEVVATADPVQKAVIDAVLSASSNLEQSTTASNSNSHSLVELKSTATTIGPFDITTNLQGALGGTIGITGTYTMTADASSIITSLVLKQIFTGYIVQVNTSNYTVNGTINYNSSIAMNSSSQISYHKSEINGSLKISGPNYSKTSLFALSVTFDSSQKGTVTGTIDGAKITYVK